MGKLKERLVRFHDAQERIRKEVELVERYERAAPNLERIIDLVEGDNTMRQRRDAERMGIRKCMQTYSGVYTETYDEEVDVVSEYMEAYDRLKLTDDALSPKLSIEEVRTTQYRDVVENFLYTEWLEYDDGIGTFSHFCTFVSLKAFVNLMTRHRDSLQALLDLGIYIPDDLRNRCVELKEREDYDPNDPVWYVRTVLTEIPEAWYVSQDLLVHYSQQARLENVESPLPDNPFTDRVDSDRARIRQAIHAYAAKEGSVKDLSKKYGLSRRQLQDELRAAGLLRGHGGRRRG